MSHKSIIFHNVSFSYDSVIQPLFDKLFVNFSKGWTGVVGANGAGKSTLLKLSSGMLEPQKGRVSSSGTAIYCEQRTDDIPDRFVDFIKAVDGDACEVKGRLGIDDEWIDRWDSLSHGERKRAQIATAIWQKPQILAVDEPTNHLDYEARELLAVVLSTFKGIGLLVSHDRELLDDLCMQCLYLEPSEAIMRSGNFTKSSLQREKDNEYLRKQYAHAKNDYTRLLHETAKRRDGAAQSHRKRSKRGLALKDHDSRFKKNLVRYSGKDGAGGKKLRQLNGRLSQAAERKRNIKVKKTYNLGIWLPGSSSKRNTLFSIEAGEIPLGGDRRLQYPDLMMQPDDRIALTGQNGSGKSTIVQHVVQFLNISESQVIYVPQEIDLNLSKRIMADARTLPNDELGKMMTVVSCLGSRPHRLLESMEPSPGEIRKVLLATGIARIPQIIIMDEPTNHLDLPSIECLENALSDCPCGLLLISHDIRFLNRLTWKQWHISQDRRDQGVYILQTS